MGWFTRSKAPKPVAEVSERDTLLDDVWTKCPGCEVITFTKELKKSIGVCPKCNYHFRLTASQRIPLLTDRHSFVELDYDLQSTDPLNFKDSKRYKERLKRAAKASESPEAVRTGKARINNIPVMLGVFEFGFMGGSMGSVVGEKLTRMIEIGIEEKKPVIIVSASGGARMQEGIYSLMQMAKVSAALAKLGSNHLPYISVLTDPTTGGVAASFAMLGDIIIAEPKALIGFAGPRVIEQTIRQKLPEGFQRAEFLLEHGIIDRIVQRADMKDELTIILKNLGFSA
ncbi:MAG TPA: acetyl-CoA carboxylase, carboxyltransferase subunit beta [Oligoflexia bacterium]|nr:acetyl-CoA carboxylase, carboxyltransferase subunit beta [Oligoflexia bacterium]HMP26402.1 acetyl-CoA carboxylase, carboxyltransferase subunit beta [Oligoflexia bacterium]